MKLPRIFSRGALVLALGASAGFAMLQMAGGCQQSPTVVPVRSMSNSGHVSFVCLSPTEPSERPLSDCTDQQFTSICQYEYEDDAGDIDAGVTYDDAGNPIATLLPHLYALVTQDTTGEVAVVDTSAVAGGVLNENPLEPGANFLQIGAGPTGIVSTPGSVATFVGVSEIGRQGIFAIPSSMIRPTASFGVPDTCIGPADAAAVPPPQFTSWPACYLDTAPGDILLIDDPPLPTGLQRRTCNGPYDGIDPKVDTISAKEPFHGRSKLVVSLPDKGGIAVFDAQDVLNRAPGSFEPCKPEAWLPLTVDLTGLAAQPAPYPTNACGNPAVQTPPLQASYTPRPAGMSYADGKLYVADSNAPVIHVVDMHDVVPGQGEIVTPCNPKEQAPLLPTSVDEPQRVVFTTKVTAAPFATPDFHRYLYATDRFGATGTENASAMIFDIGPNSATRRPLQRKHPEWNPFQPRDRVVFAAPAADIILVEHDEPAIDPVTGVASGGVLCNDDPRAVTCIAGGHNCDPGTSYRTSTDYTLGAGPQKLRGEFAFAALTNGKVAVIDVDDFDAPCRGPQADTALQGCSSNASGLVTSAEWSCNTVSFGEPRSADYLAVGTLAGNHVPGLQTFPLLYAADGTVLADTSSATAPRMVATLPWKPGTGGTQDITIPPACTQSCDPNGCGNTCDDLPGCPLELFVGGQQTPIDVQSSVCTTACAPQGAPCKSQADCCGGVNGSTCNTSGVCQPATCSKDTGAACVPSSVNDQTCTAANCVGHWTTPTTLPSFTPGAVGSNNALLLNMEDPRVHVADQNWSVAFEGAIPGFDQFFATLTQDMPGVATLESTQGSIQFCDHGVLSEAAFGQMLAAQPKSTSLTATDLADYVQITSDIPEADDPYWTSGGAMMGSVTCDYASCLDAFGPIDAPELYTTRDLRITQAYQDHVEVVPRGKASFDQILCCFPGALQFTVRVGNQWAVTADQSGFIHHVIADGTTGACINSCDPTLARKNARLIETAPTLFPAELPDRAPGEGDPSPSFQNPMFRFAIVTGKQKCSADTDCIKDKNTTGICAQGYCADKVPDGATCKVSSDCSTSGSECIGGSCIHPGALWTVPTQRDSVFKFTTTNSFVPLQVSLATDGTSLILPRSITYLPATTELAVTDGINNGLIMVSLQTAQVSRSFF